MNAEVTELATVDHAKLQPAPLAAPNTQGLTESRAHRVVHRQERNETNQPVRKMLAACARFPARPETCQTYDSEIVAFKTFLFVSKNDRFTRGKRVFLR